MKYDFNIISVKNIYLRHLTGLALGHHCWPVVNPCGFLTHCTETPGVCSFSRNLTKIFWVSYFVEFVLGRFSHFNIAIAYSNSKFCGAWTPSFCEFTCNLSKTSTPQETYLEYCVNTQKIQKWPTSYSTHFLTFIEYFKTLFVKRKGQSIRKDVRITHMSKLFILL